MISQLFILSPRGDVIINKQFRLDVPVKITTEVFFRTVKFWTDGDKAPAVFNEDGVNYVHVKVAGLFVAVDRLAIAAGATPDDARHDRCNREELRKDY